MVLVDCKERQWPSLAKARCSTAAGKLPLPQANAQHLIFILFQPTLPHAHAQHLIFNLFLPLGFFLMLILMLSASTFLFAMIMIPTSHKSKLLSCGSFGAPQTWGPELKVA